MYYGVILVIEKYVWGVFLDEIPKAAARVYTGILVLVGWVFFFSPSLGYSLRYLSAMIGAGAGIVDAQAGFRVAVVLPRGTNGPRPSLSLVSPEDALLRARNKWLIAHPESAEAADGAFAGLTGENIDISADI